MIGFNKTKEKYGWMGNMAAYPIRHDGKLWKTCEALFQAMRFDDPQIIEEIRSYSSPMRAKMIAKKHKAKMVVTPLSEVDLANMKACLRIKFTQHKGLAEMLRITGDRVIYEDVSARINKGSSLFWGAYLRDGELVGENVLGKLLMDLRKSIQDGTFF